MNTDITADLNNGLDQGTPNHHLGIERMGNEATDKDYGQRSNLDNMGMQLQKLQEKYIAERKDLLGDKILTDTQKDYFVYNTMEAYAKEAFTALDGMEAEQARLAKVYDEQLYSNSFKLGEYARAMLNVNAINEKLFEDPSKHIGNPHLAEVVALHCKGDMYSKGTRESVEKQLNEKYTPDTVANVEANDFWAKKIESAKVGVRKQVNSLRVSPENYEKLSASHKLREHNRKMGFR